MGLHRTSLTIPTSLPRGNLLTEAQLAALLKVTSETLRAWRRRGEMPPVAEGAEAVAFAKSQHTRGRLPIVYRMREVKAWLNTLQPAPQPRSAKPGPPHHPQNARPQAVSSNLPLPPPPAAFAQPALREPPEHPRDVLGRPLSAATLLYEELDRRARELGPIPGF
jgi:hypothetical protein